MSTVRGGPPKLTDQQCLEAVNLLAEHRGNQTAAAAAAGKSRSAFQQRLSEAAARGIEAGRFITSEIELPVFPDEHMSVERELDYRSEQFLKRKASHDAHTWFKVKVKEKKPIGLLWFGDPHIDDDGCNLPVLRRHCSIAKTTEGIYGANIGDTTNNWAGRLSHLYAKQDTSVSTAQRHATWFMLDSGVKWLIWLYGNHDKWGDGSAVLGQMAKRYGTQGLVCHDWEVRFILSFPNGCEFKINAAHNFKGSSIWNLLHGPMREAQLGEDAHLVICGDKHEWGFFTTENAKRRITQTAARVRGYKFMDDYARVHGYPEQQSGCALLTVFNPSTSLLRTFDDIEEGAGYLTWLRGRS